MDKYVGKRLEGRYELQELIGMGGMSNVYRAYDSIDQRTVAVKILRDEYSNNTEFLRRFKNESKAIAVLSHPNIVKVYDVSFTNHVNSIVMEFISGITLKEYIERKGLLSWKEAVHFSLQILRALQHAHDKGIVHRDIKPQNIMLLQDGTIKVTDFGIARFARSESKTITDRAIGSVHYISPEQAKGENTDEKSDVYSVGVMLFEMLTGKLPFEADSPVSVAIKQIQTAAVLPRSLNPEIPLGLEQITVRAMQKDAGSRYQSAAEMIQDIERFRQDPTMQFAYKYPAEGAKTTLRRPQGPSAQNEESKKVMQVRRTPYIPVLTGVTFAFVLASIGFMALMVYFNNPFTKVEEKNLPNLIGLKYDTVLSDREFDFFEITDVVSEYNEEYGKGVIFEQTPKAGRSIKVGAGVQVKVSSGQRIVTLPNFAGKDIHQVFARLNDLGLEPNEKRIYSDDTPLGSVVYTDPSKDASLPAGTVVTVYVSMGPEEKWSNVPDVTGHTLESARRLLEVSNLLVGQITYDPYDAPKDSVVAQDPPQGSLQPEGTSVNLVISLGPIGDPTRYSIPVTLPESIDRTVTMKAKQDDEYVAEEMLNPSDASVWKPVFQGQMGESTIKIYLDGKLYQEYVLDFNKGTRRKTQDYSGEFR